MSEKEQYRKVRQAFADAEAGQVPAFDSVFAAAQQQTLRSRYRYMKVGSAAAAVAVLAIVIGNWTSHNGSDMDEFMIADAMLNTTQWSAPSDALMPSHRFDIYQDIPVLMESTELQEGSLL